MVPYSGLTLAYIGDAYYELMVRRHLLAKGVTRVHKLHDAAIRFTSAEGQADAFDIIKGDLTEDEMITFKRGRNAKTDRKARNASLATYRQATGFEALVGYLHITSQDDRLDELFAKITKQFDK